MGLRIEPTCRPASVGPLSAHDPESAGFFTDTNNDANTSLRSRKCPSYGIVCAISPSPRLLSLTLRDNVTEVRPCAAVAADSLDEPGHRNSDIGAVRLLADAYFGGPTARPNGSRNVRRGCESIDS
jgi:hypothetical protein